ncbi:MAG: CoA ester lyase [Candidatus Rokubacteria bacterium]|nr:CoA ester lyase [Candidatus Rokubacteria bacterium]
MSRLRRSVLFIAGSDEDALALAGHAGADTVILDLEDTVAPARKQEARRLVVACLRDRSGPATEYAVRVNAAASVEFRDDVDAVVAAGADALVIPKTQNADTLREIDTWLGSLEQRHGRRAAAVRLLPLIETPAGVLNAAAIAVATPRIDALVLGHVDLSRTLGVPETGAGAAIILHARAQLVFAAKAAGIDAIDTVYMRDDDAGFESEARQALALGFTGKLLVHPRQVDLVHAVYAPTAEDIDYARRLVAAFEAAEAAGQGLFVFEGRVIDLPVVAAERTVLARARAAGL